MIVDEENGSGFEAITMDGGPFDSLTITRLEDGGMKLSIDRDAVVWKQHAEGTMCAEDVARLAEWLTPTRDSALAAMTQRAKQAEHLSDALKREDDGVCGHCGEDAVRASIDTAEYPHSVYAVRYCPVCHNAWVREEPVRPGADQL